MCVASEQGWMFGSCCLMIKGVMLLLEASGAEICAQTLGNTCPVILQAVFGLLHICCKNSLTTCSKPKWAEVISVCPGATSLGFLGVHVAKTFICIQKKYSGRLERWGVPRGKLALAWWYILISVRRGYNLISGNICWWTSDCPHVP